jgi:glutaminyl-tRNA synthetase
MSDAPRTSNFLTDIVEADLAAGRTGGRVITRFPPEPNGFLHIGHAKSICLNFGLARQYGGRTHLRFDDTNPTTEETEYVEAIQEDVRWLGWEWGKHLYYASDFFEQMYQCAERLVREGKAYVDSQPQEAIREQRGSFERPGRAGPFRDRPAKESLDLFHRMRAGEFPDGACVLRARVDMAHPNVLMRDPLLYRIRHANHHRTGDRWCIYPMYDYAHPLEDAFEGVTHSICTLEFETNRELYDWVLDNLGPWDPRPHQYEFARLALGYTVMSKRKLLQLVNEKRVSGWDDPRMPTIAGMRRRGVTAEALRDFADLIGVAKNNSLVDIGKLEFAIRGDLEKRSPRAMAVLNPLPLTIENWPVDRMEDLDIPWWPGEPERGGSRAVPFGRELLVERDDFSTEPPPDWKRLAPGREVRLAGAYVIRCEEVLRDGSGALQTLRCSYRADSRQPRVGGPDRKRALGTIHWVHASRSVSAEVRLYDRLFQVEQPDTEGDFLSALNPDSLALARGARVEPALAQAAAGSRYQFLRQGYFFVDPVDSRPGAPVFNRTIALKDTWSTRAQARPDSRKPRAKEESAPPPPGTSAAGRQSLRAELHASDRALATRFARYHAELGLIEEEADILAADPAVSDYFDVAVDAHRKATPAERGNVRSVSRWLVNELLGMARGTRLDVLPLDGAGFGRFVSLVDQGLVTQAAAKVLLASLVEKGGDPLARLKELGLGKVEDRSAIESAVDGVLTAHATEVGRYRSGEKKLLGVFIGAVMRQVQGADAALVREVLQRKLR